MTEPPTLRRGQLWTLARVVEELGITAGGTVLILQNDPYNRNTSYPWTLVAAIGMTRRDVPTHVPFAVEDVPEAHKEGAVDAGIRCERLACVRKEWLALCIGQLSAATMQRVNQAV